MTKSNSGFEEQRLWMVERQLKSRRIHDPATLDSMLQVPRHMFVPDGLRPLAYEDGPLLIGCEQTISQPYIVALMTQAARLSSTSVVLEIGTGSGYAAAVLSLIAKEVYTVERISELAEEAKQRFAQLGYGNIHVKIADGTLGWPEKGPFDAIIVTAAAPEVPRTLFGQLASGGTMVIPIGDRVSQDLVRLTKKEGGDFMEENLGAVRFVPLIGEEGWRPDTL